LLHNVQIFVLLGVEKGGNDIRETTKPTIHKRQSWKWGRREE